MRWYLINGKWIMGKGSKKKHNKYTPKLLDKKQVDHLKRIQGQ